MPQPPSPASAPAVMIERGTAPGVWGTLAAITVARIAFGYQLQTVASLGPDLLVVFALTLSTLGSLMGAYMLPGLLVALPSGLLGRRFGERDVITFGLVLMTVGSLLCANAYSALALGVGRVVAGAGAVSLTVLQGKVVADRFQGRRFVPAMSLLVGAFPIGIGIAQLTQRRLDAAFGWPTSFYAGAAVSCLAALLLRATWHDADPGRSRSWRWPSRRECVLAVIAGVIWTFYNAGYFNFLAFMPTYLAFHHHSPSDADWVVGLATWGNLPAILLGGLAASRWGENRVFLAGALLSSVSVLGVFFLDWPLLWGVVFGTLASIHAGLIVAAGTLSARPENRAVGMALFYVVYYVGGSIIPALCGHVADAVGDPRGAFLCAGLLSSLTIPFWFLHRWMAARSHV